MILPDTSIWIDHFKARIEKLGPLLVWGQVIGHPFVIGELAVGDLGDWRDTVTMLRALPSTRVASEDEFLRLIASENLARTGLGFVDVHLLAACRLTPGTRLWTRDKRLAARAEAMGVSWAEA